MTERNLFLIAVAGYGLSMLYSVFLWRKDLRRDDRINYGLLLGAFAFHTRAMLLRGFSLHRCPVNNLFEAMMFLAWVIVGAYLVLGLLPRLRFLGVYAAPFVFAISVFALMPELDTPDKASDVNHTLRSLHAALTLLSYGAFGLSAVAALMFLSQEHDLKFRKLRAAFSLVPPIERLEKIMTRLSVMGLLLLTAGLLLGPALLRQVKQVQGAGIADPKVPWSAIVWAAYLAILILHACAKQTGRRFAWWIVGAFVFVLLTFWGTNLLSPVHRL